MNASDRARRLLRWYPAAWRQRYGDEFAALIEEAIGEGAPSLRLRMNVIRSGLAMRLSEAGRAGDAAPPREWVRGGALAVLCAWSMFVVAGIGLQKAAEHWQDAVPIGAARTAAEIAFGAVQVVAGLGSLLVVAGAVVVLPAVLRSLGEGGWRALRRPYLWAAATCSVTAVAFGGLVWWAQRLSEPQRNGGDAAYGLSAALFALLVLASITTLTVAGVATVRRLSLSPPVLRIEGYLAGGVAGAMAVIAAAAGVWWGVVASAAPWFFIAGARAGQRGSPVGAQTVAIATLMLLAIVLASFGVRRVVRGARALLL